MIFVFDLGFGERSAVVDAPVNWFETSIHIALFEERDECAGDAGFVIWVHSQVGLFALPEDAQIRGTYVEIPRQILFPFPLALFQP